MFFIILIAIIIYIIYTITKSSNSTTDVFSASNIIDSSQNLDKYELLYEDEKQKICLNKDPRKLIHYNKSTKILQSEYVSYPSGLIDKYYIPNITQYPNYDTKTAKIVDRFIILKQLFSLEYVECYGFTDNYKNNKVKYFETWSQRWDNSGDVIDEGPDTPILVFYQKEIYSLSEYYSLYLLEDQTLLSVFNLDRTGYDKCAYHLDKDLKLLNYEENTLSHRDAHALEILRKLITDDLLYP